MKKTNASIIAIFLLLLVIPNAVYAHTGLKSSNPENNQIVKEQLKEIALTFNTDIEPLSSFEVVDDNGTEYKVSDINIDKSQMIGTMAEPLNDGTYTVNWKIIGRDGHPIKGTLTFRVEVPLAETPTFPSEETGIALPTPSASSSPESAPASPSSVPTGQTQSDSDSEGSSLAAQSNASWIFLGLAALVFVVFVTLALVKRKKK